MKITDRVTVTAPKSKGLYWATRTLLQLTELQGNQALPKGTARDYPDYAIRGFMMDCGRKFIPMSMLRDYVKMMAYYKMNTFQIHLTIMLSSSIIIMIGTRPIRLSVSNAKLTRTDCP